MSKCTKIAHRLKTKRLSASIDLSRRRTKNMFKIIVVEDQEKWWEQISSYLSVYSKDNDVLFEVARFATGESFLAQYDGSADLVFMDIGLPEKNGIDTSKELRLKDGRVCIVFLTELSQFAIEGYEVRAFDYLVKPIKYDLFSLKLTRILAHLSQSIRKYATIKDGTLTTRVCFDDIVYIESQKHYVYFHCLDQEYRTRGRLEDIQGEFLAAGFSRINRSIIVNLAHVNGYTSTDVTVKGESLPLSRVYKTDFLRELTLYLGKKH